MGKRINFLSETRPKLPVFSREFTDVLQPGKSFWLHLAPLDSVDTYVGVDVAQHAIKQYIDGDPTNPEPAYHKPAPFQPIDGKSPIITESLCYTIGAIVAQMSPVDAEGKDVRDEAYTFDEIVAMSLTWPNAWEQVREFSAEVSKSGEKFLKNG